MLCCDGVAIGAEGDGEVARGGGDRPAVGDRLYDAHYGYAYGEL